VNGVPTDPARCGVFVNYRRDDTGWAANLLTDTLRRRLGYSAEVFIDNRSIDLGEAFAKVLEDGIRRSAVLVVLIGQRWTEPPLVDRLFDAIDWVRREILLAHQQGSTVVPVLVDRDSLPAAAVLPDQLQFLPGLQAAQVRQAHPEDLEVLAESIAALIPPGCRGTKVRSEMGVEPIRATVDALLRHILPPAQQWSGNRDRLVDLVLALLSGEDRLVYLVPARLEQRPRGSATMIVTESDIVVAEVDETFRIIGEIRLPRESVRRVEVVPTLPLFADVVLHTTAGDPVELLGLFRDQARRLADHLRS
jgi:hypothetical protein